MQIRNKQVTKHFTEKTIKEIWKGRMAEHKSGKATDLCDFVCNHLQKKVGIMSAVIEVRSKGDQQHRWPCKAQGIHGGLAKFVALMMASENPRHYSLRIKRSALRYPCCIMEVLFPPCSNCT